MENARFHVLDWETADLKLLGWQKRFQLVFASRTPAVYDRVTLEKMTEASRGYCCLITQVTGDNSVRRELTPVVGATNDDDYTRRGLYCAFNILWLQGYYPEVEYLERTWDSECPLEEAIVMYTRHFNSRGQLSEVQEIALADKLCAMLGSSRGPQSAEEIVDTLERSNVNALFVIGGDGTMKAALAISSEVQARGLKISVIGIPKTIDNDINFIPQSFGFETAAFKATEAIECAHTEACGVPNGIGLVKLMGRESGFIAARAALALKEVNFVLIPEAPFALEGEGGLLPALEERLRSRGHEVPRSWRFRRADGHPLCGYPRMRCR